MESPTMIIFDCISCGAKLQVPESMAGVTGPCPRCGVEVKAPQAESKEEQPVAETVPTVEKKPVDSPTEMESLVDSSAPQSQNSADMPLAPRTYRGNARSRKSLGRFIFPLVFVLASAVLLVVVFQTVEVMDLWSPDEGKAQNKATEEEISPTIKEPEVNTATPEVTPHIPQIEPVKIPKPDIVPPAKIPPVEQEPKSEKLPKPPPVYIPPKEEFPDLTPPSVDSLL